MELEAVKLNSPPFSGFSQQQTHPACVFVGWSCSAGDGLKCFHVIYGQQQGNFIEGDQKRDPSVGTPPLPAIPSCGSFYVPGSTFSFGTAFCSCRVRYPPDTDEHPSTTSPGGPEENGPRCLHLTGGGVEPYYANRPAMPNSATRVPPSSAPRAVGPHVYPTGSQMMMLPPQQIPFPNQQGAAYFIQSGQYRPQYVTTTQPYPVAPGTPGFYPGSSPAEYGTYAQLGAGSRTSLGHDGGSDLKSAGLAQKAEGNDRRCSFSRKLNLLECGLDELQALSGAYYPAQGVSQYPPTVQASTVMMNPGPGQQAPPKRERKQIRIRDPNQGGRDITEEIMSGGRTTSTPTPPQSVVSGSEGGNAAQANGENIAPVSVVIRPDDRQKPATPAATTIASKPRELGKTEAAPAPTAPPTAETKSDTDTKAALIDTAPEPLGETLADTTAPTALPTSDRVDSPPVTNTAAPDNVLHTEYPVAMEMEKKVQEEEMEMEVEVVHKPEQKATVATQPIETAPLLEDAAMEQISATNGLSTAEPAVPEELPAVSQKAPAAPACEPPVDSPIAQPEELKPLANGLAAPSAQDPEEAPEEAPECDISPIAEPEVAQPQEAPVVTATPVPQLPPTQAEERGDTPPPQPSFTPGETSVQASNGDALASQVLEQLNCCTTLDFVLRYICCWQLSVFLELLVTKSTKTNLPSNPQGDDIVCSVHPWADTLPASLVSFIDIDCNFCHTAAVLVPKKKRKLKDLNKKEAVGDLLDAFKEEQVKENRSEPEQAQQAVAPPENEASRPSHAEETEETWEEKEDKLDTENIEPEPVKPGDQKYQYKEEQWKPINPEEKKKYDREFLLGFQFICASMQKPEGLPHISDVVLDKANKTPLRPLDPSRLTGMNCGPDFTPSFANLGRQPMGGRGPPSGMGPRRSQQGQRKEPRKIIASVSLTDDVQLNKAEKAWKPAVKKISKEKEEDEPETAKTQELFRRVRSILNKLTPQMFQQLMKQVTELTIDTEERLKGVIDLIFEKAISEPNFSVAYANMCRCLIALKVPTADKPQATVNFRKLLLIAAHKEFEKDKDDDEVFEKKQKELDAASGEERQHLREELDDAKDKARRRSLGNIKFIGELFKLKMLTEPIMHDCIVKLLKNHDEESLECLCRLLSTIGKDLDFEKAKPRMDQYFNQMEKIIKERKTSSRIRFMLQDVLDLRRNNWVPRRGDQGPKTIDQIHKEAELEEHREQIKVQQQLMSKKDSRRGGPGGPHPSAGRSAQPQDEGWNTVPISKNRPIDTSRLSKITKPGAMDFNNQLLAPGGRLSWGKGSSGGSGSKPAEQSSDTGRPATSTLNRFSALQQSSMPSGTVSGDNESRRVPQRSSSSRDRGERSDREKASERGDRNRPPITKRSYSKETEDRSREREHRGPADPLRRVASMTDDRDRGSRERARSKESVKREPASAPAPAPAKPALSEDELEKKSKAIIEEYLHINDMKEAVQCVQEMNSVSLLFIFVRNGIESTLERSTIAREHMGLLLYQLVKAGTMPIEQYFKGLQEILEVAEDMAIDIPHIWLYLAEIITPMLHEGGIPMDLLFKEVSKPLVPLGKAGLLLVEILSLLCKEMSHKKAGALWREAGLSWKDFLPEDEDVNKFVTEKKVEFTLGDDSEKMSKKELTSEELCRQLERLIKEKADNQRIYDWVEANLDEQQVSSNMFIRAVMTSVCQSAIIYENPYKVDTEQITQRAKLLQKYLTDEQKELQALYALQALMVKLEQPANLLRMFFDTLYDEDVIKEEAFYKWESSKDPAEQLGKGVALKSVTAFFTWLREAEDESDNS
ncbi:IF4G1 factor, partial [Atractosteus spatula]|nr:IF4G1 factor [Atractosteus spatula]